MLKIITVSNLQSSSESELRGLFAEASKSLVQSERGSTTRNFRLAALSAIQDEMNRRGSVAWRKAAGF